MTKDLREEAMFQVQMLGEEIQPDWIGLTDDEILSISADCAATHQHTDIHFARAIEAKLKEKNGL
jgi:hypothetical protein